MGFFAKDKNAGPKNNSGLSTPPHGSPAGNKPNTGKPPKRMRPGGSEGPKKKG